MSETHAEKPAAVVVFFVLAFVLSWAVWLPAASTPDSPAALVGLLGAWGPSVAALLITAFTGKVRPLVRRIGIWRVGVWWYLFALLYPIGLLLAVTGTSVLLGHPAPDFAQPPVVTDYPFPPEAFAGGLLPLVPIVFVIQFFGSSLGEELGWRGLALPRLQAWQTALAASVLLGTLWGLWHLPRIWAPGTPFDAAGFGWFMAGIVLDAIVYTWLMNNTRGSLLPVLLLHTAQGVAPLFLATVANAPLEVGLRVVLVAVILITAGPNLAYPYPRAGAEDENDG